MPTTKTKWFTQRTMDIDHDERGRARTHITVSEQVSGEWCATAHVVGPLCGSEEQALEKLRDLLANAAK